MVTLPYTKAEIEELENVFVNSNIACKKCSDKNNHKKRWCKIISLGLKCPICKEIIVTDFNELIFDSTYKISDIFTQEDRGKIELWDGKDIYIVKLSMYTCIAYDVHFNDYCLVSPCNKYFVFRLELYNIEPDVGFNSIILGDYRNSAKNEYYSYVDRMSGRKMYESYIKKHYREIKLKKIIQRYENCENN